MKNLKEVLEQHTAETNNRYSEDIKEIRTMVFNILGMWLVSDDVNIKTRSPAEYQKIVCIREHAKETFIGKILLKRLEAFKVPVKIDGLGLTVIELCTNGTPGLALLMLHELIGENREPGTEITAIDFIKTYVFPGEDTGTCLYKFTMSMITSFDDIDLPVIDAEDSNSKWDKYFDYNWDAQKYINNGALSANKIDDPEYWLNKFKKGE